MKTVRQWVAIILAVGAVWSMFRIFSLHDIQIVFTFIFFAAVYAGVVYAVAGGFESQ